MLSPGPIVGRHFNDNADRLAQVTQGTSTVTLEYDATDRRTKTTLANGVSMGYMYDDAGQLTKIEYKQGAAVLGDLTYEYDAAGNRTAVGGSFARTGLPQAVSSAVYDSANRLTQWNGTPLTYDDNGNLTSDGTATYTWNARDKLAAMTGASFQYDPLGRRTRKTVGGVTTSFLYDGVNAVQEISGTTANLLTGFGIDEVFSRTDSAGARHFLADALGSTIGLSDGAGAIQTQYAYEPYGKVTVSGAASGNPFQYTGRENDGTGAYYYRARYYQPVSERFLSEDPIRSAGGTNFYRYVDNNPIDFTDPHGLKTFVCTAPLQAAPNLYEKVPLMYHKYLCVVGIDGKPVCGGLTRTGSALWSKGQPSVDTMKKGNCKESEPDDPCVDRCILNEFSQPRPQYSIGPLGTDCQEWAGDTLKKCRKHCGKK